MDWLTTAGSKRNSTHGDTFRSEVPDFTFAAFSRTLQDPGADQIPFYDLSWLGGREYLRGYKSYRFRGNNVLLLSTELQQTVLRVTRVRGLDGVRLRRMRGRSGGTPIASVRQLATQGVGGGIQYRHSTYFRPHGSKSSRSNEGAVIYCLCRAVSRMKVYGSIAFRAASSSSRASTVGKSTQLTLLPQWLGAKATAVSANGIRRRSCRTRPGAARRSTCSRRSPSGSSTPPTSPTASSSTSSRRSRRARSCWPTATSTPRSRATSRGASTRVGPHALSLRRGADDRVLLPRAARVALKRILGGRAALKWYEAGMDRDSAPDIEEASGFFRAPSSRSTRSMVDEFGLIVIDASRSIEGSRFRCARSSQRR